MPIPTTWLQFNPTAVPSAAAGVGAGVQINQAELAREALARQAQQQAAQQVLARQQLQQQAALQALNQLTEMQQMDLAREQFAVNQNRLSQALATDQAKEQRLSEGSALRTKAILDFQNELSQGKDIKDVYPKYAPLIDPDGFGTGIVNLLKLNAPKETTPSSSMKQVQELTDLQNKYTAALNSGNIQEAETIKSQIDTFSSLIGGSQTRIVTDPVTGRVTEIISGKGIKDQKLPSEMIGTPTPSVMTDIQKNNANYEDAIQILGKLEAAIRPEDVGVQGVVGNVVNDKLLAQIFPQFANNERISNRQLLGSVSESLLRDVSDDERFSNADRTAISRLLPSLGAVTSYQDVIGVIGQLRDLLSNRTKTYHSQFKIEPPLFSLTPQEIGDRYKSGKITLEEAKDALEKYYPKQFPKVR